MKPIFLDYNATTPTAPSVQEAMLPFMAEYFATPAASYAAGRAVEESLEDARGQVAFLLGAMPDEVIFTASGTESCNLAIKGVMLASLPQIKGSHLIVSTVEHPAVQEPARYLRRLGFEVTQLPVDRNGLVDPASLEAAIRPTTRLVSIGLANDQTGVIQPIRKLAEICHRHGTLLHSDACQAAGKIPVNAHQLGVDLLSITAHKFYGPKGAAALLLREGVPLVPLIHGDGNQRSLRAGTENSLAWIGMGAAANLVGRCLDEAHVRLEGLRDRLQNSLFSAVPDGLIVHGRRAPRLPNTLSVNFPGVSAVDLLRRVPEIQAQTQASYHTIRGCTSKVLAAMGLSTAEKEGTVRLSIGWHTSQEEIDRAADLLAHAWESCRNK